MDVCELQNLFKDLAMTPQQLLRRGDAKKLGLSGNETAEKLIELMAKHPTLLQRPILAGNGRAMLGRPVENLLEMI